MSHKITQAELRLLQVSLRLLPKFDPTGVWVYDQAGVRAMALNSEVALPEILQGAASQALNHPMARMVVDLWKHNPAIDLADIATADRVARYIAKHMGLTAGVTAPSWGPGMCSPDCNDLEPERRWILTGEGEEWGSTQESDWDENDIPALAHLDPLDDRRLDNGVRFVDLLAMLIVAQHIGETITAAEAW